MQIYSDNMKNKLDSIKRYKLTKSFNKANNLKYLIKFNKEDILKESYETLLSYVEQDLSFYLGNGLKPSDIIMGISTNFYKKTFTKEELDKVAKINEQTKKIGIPFGIFDYFDLYSVDEVKTASDKINGLAKEINSHNLSPFEKIMLCNMKITKYTYMENKRDFFNNESHSTSRSVYSILNGSNRIVCAGYAELVKTIMDTVDDENIKVFNNEVSVYDKEDKSYDLHQNNIVYLKDDKYGIEGFYYLDPTWNRDKKTEIKLNCAFLAIDEIKDLGDIKDYSRGLTYKYSKLKNQNNKVHQPIRVKDKNIKFGVGWPMYSSVSENKVELFKPYLDNQKTAALTLEEYLCSRQDFKDYLVLTEAKKDEQKNKKEKIEKIYNKVQKNPSLSPVYHNKKAIFEYLSERSKHIDFDKLQTCLYKVMPYFKKENTKDDSSKKAYEVINRSIERSKIYYINKDATNELKIMCDSLEK